MIESVGTLLGRLQGLFSKSFLLAGLLPSGLFLGLNVALAYWIVRPLRPHIASVIAEADQATMLFALTATLLVVGFGLVLLGLHPWFRQLLEGQYLLPEWLRGILAARQHQELNRLRAQVEELDPERISLRNAVEKQPTWIQQLRQARALGNAKAGLGDEHFASLTAKIEALERLEKRYQRIPYDELRKCFEELRNALEASRAGGGALDMLQTRFRKLLDYAVSRTENAFNRARREQLLRFPLEQANLGPTRMANVAEVHREYGVRRYGLDIEVLWLRLLKTVRSDEELAPILDEAKTQLDFAVSMTVLLGVLTGGWAFLSMAIGDSPVPFLLVMMLGTWMTALFYGIALQNYRTFAEAVRSAIDLHRFSLLEALHVPLPNDSREERQLWRRLMEWSRVADHDPILFRHPRGEKTNLDVDSAKGLIPVDERSALRRIARAFGLR